jgi:hypothetical protein
MSKVVGAVVGVFMMGAAAQSMLSGVLGAYAEPMSLGLVGLGLWTTAQAFGARAAHDAQHPTHDVITKTS